MKHNVFVALSTFVEHDQRPLELLEQSGQQFHVHSTGKRITTEELLRDGRDATVIVAGPEVYDAAIFAKLPALQCISRCGVGFDAIDLDAARKRGIAVANTPTIPTYAVAEMALTLFLALSRNLRRQASTMAAGRWDRLTAHLLAGRTIGLLGFGRIGQRVAQLCQAFDARVIAHDPMHNSAAAQTLGVTLVGMEDLLRQVDILSLHASRTAGQSVLIGAPELALMKPGVMLVNLARGGMVDEDALVKALRSGHVAAAALDVFNKEPYRGPLSDFDQVILTPHSATLTVETRAAMEIQAVENALAFITGEIPPDRRVL